MRKRAIWLLLMVFFTVTGQAAEQDERQKTIRGNEAMGKKVRSVFLSTIRGEKYVFIRLTPGQFTTGKIRSRLRHGKGFVRTALRPRQLKILNKIVRKEKKDGDDKGRVRLVIRIPAKVLQKKGLKSLYVIRPLSIFLRGRDEEIVEEDPQPYTADESEKDHDRGFGRRR